MGYKWILIDGQLPEPDKYILLSFENFTLPQIGRYEINENGDGAFYLGDEEKSLASYGLFVNAWMHLPKCYREE